MRSIALFLSLLVAGVLLPVPASAGEPSAPAPIVTVPMLEREARARVTAPARVPLKLDGLPELEAPLRLHGMEAPNYLLPLRDIPDAVRPFAELVHAVFYRGALSTEIKAAMGLRVAQVNASPYVAAHASRILRSSERGRSLLDALRAGALEELGRPEGLALRYAERLTRSVHGVTDEEFAKIRAVYDDGEIVELTIVTAFFNYFTRYAEALRLPVESWAVDGQAPEAAAGAHVPKARVALITDDEIAATSAALAVAVDPGVQRSGLGLGMANSQRAMLRAPALGVPWRVYGSTIRANDTMGRELKLQVSFAVSVANDCRYCTIHQVLGLRRLGIDPAKLVAMRKDDSVLSRRELVAVQFARKLTDQPGGMTDADYQKLMTEFGSRGALELLLQTCAFAFMNRFTDGLLLPSEDEAVRVYQEVYGQ